MKFSGFSQTDTTSIQELVTITKDEYKLLGTEILRLTTENQLLKNEVAIQDSIINDFKLYMITAQDLLATKEDIIENLEEVKDIQSIWIEDQKKLLRKNLMTTSFITLGGAAILTTLLILK